jgi:hypothetical protein
MSGRQPFTKSTIAAMRFWQTLLDVAKGANLVNSGGSVPSAEDLRVICNEIGYPMPDLLAFAKALQRQPALMLIGGDRQMAREMATAFGYNPDLAVIPEAQMVLRMTRGVAGSARFGGGDEAPGERLRSLAVIEERFENRSLWDFVWVPHPHFFNQSLEQDIARCLQMSQRGAVIIEEDTPPALCELFETLGQKLWIISKKDIRTEDDRRKLLAQVINLSFDTPEQMLIRHTSAWQWLTLRQLDQISNLKLQNEKILSRYETRLMTARHLLTQYRTHWQGGVKTIVETYLQNRIGSQAFAPFWDSKNPGLQPESFLAAMAMAGLWSKLAEYITDRMADFVSGLGGLAAKIEVVRITLGEAKAKWDTRPIGQKIIRELMDKKVFPSDNSKKSGLVGNLTGRKQAVTDERKAQVSKAIRIVGTEIETNFAEWSTLLISTVESGIIAQLDAGLAKQGFSNAESLRHSSEALDRLELMMRGQLPVPRHPEAVAAEWLHALSSAPMIPPYHPTKLALL